MKKASKKQKYVTDFSKQVELVSFRDLTPEQFKQLQRLIRQVKSRSDFKPQNKDVTNTIEEYQKKFHVSRDVARDDYIFLWLRELQTYINRKARQAYNMAQKYGNFADRTYGRYSKADKADAQSYLTSFENALNNVDKWIDKRQYNTDWNDNEIYFLSQPNEVAKKTLSDFNGSYAKLAVYNYLRALSQRGYYFMLGQLEDIPPNIILDFWKKNADRVALDFTYDLTDSGEEQSLLGLWVRYLKNHHPELLNKDGVDLMSVDLEEAYGVYYE